MTSRAGVEGEAMNFRILGILFALALLLGSVSLLGYILGISTLISTCPPVLEYLKVFFDFISGIAWPAAVIGIALLFKRDIRQILPRIRKLGTSGVEIEGLEQQQLSPTISTEQPVNLAEITPTIADFESRIRGDLDNVIPERREPILIRQLALTQAAAFFENTYGLIFGSQIEGLQRLNAVGAIAIEDARNFFETDVRPRFAADAQGVNFDTWSAFLFSRGLIGIDREKVVIKELGKEFLRFLEVQNRSLNRPL